MADIVTMCNTQLPINSMECMTCAQLRTTRIGSPGLQQLTQQIPAKRQPMHKRTVFLLRSGELSILVVTHTVLSCAQGRLLGQRAYSEMAVLCQFCNLSSRHYNLIFLTLQAERPG